ncbi:MAG: hypothetical protein ACK4E3_06740 [Brevundimonas sp.]|uniref:SEL1-like repeat protein n=1 Tax=Brevundimonas sp. TaxID=1871086 RepID=UPI00391D7473
MIMEGDDDEGVVPLSRRAHATDSFERRGRARRFDDAYGSGESGIMGGGHYGSAGAADDLARVLARIEMMASRLEAAEARSATAISGIDQAVAGLVRRFDAEEQTRSQQTRRIEDIAEELREGHKRLRKLEHEAGPRVAEAFQKLEGSLGGLAGRVYETEDRTRLALSELREKVERLDRDSLRGGGAELVAQMGARLDAAQARTAEALRVLETSFAGLDRRLAPLERVGAGEGAAREAARFEKLAEALARSVEDSRNEMMRRLDAAAAENRVDKIERAVAHIGEQVQAAERRSAAAVEAMGKEVIRIARNLDARMVNAETDSARRVEALGQDLSRTLGQDVSRVAQALEQRLVRDSDQHAAALEKLGTEISRISERLSERIAQSERRSAQAIEDIGQRLNRASEKIEQRHERTSGELAERLRQSEERTARLLAEARESIERRASEARPQDGSARGPDWRASAFGDDAFGDDAFGDGSFADQSVSAAAADPGAPAPGWQAPGVAPFPDTPDFADLAPSALVEPEAAPAEPDATAPDEAPPIRPVFGTRSETLAESRPAAYQASAILDPRPGADASGLSGEGLDDVGYAAETDFVSARELRAGSTRDAIQAARAAMGAGPEDTRPSSRKASRTRLQERLERQSRKDGSTFRKALLSSVTAVALVSAVFGYTRLTSGEGLLPGAGIGAGEREDAPGAPLAAAAVVTTGASAALDADFQRGRELLEGNDRAGLALVRAAAEQGHTGAQLYMARVYDLGEAGESADPAEARLWTERAARAGDAGAMYNLGVYLFDGVGGSRNQAEAAQWFRRSADAGLIDAQYNLAQILENGAEGVRAQPSEAYRWYRIAARSGDEQAAQAARRLEPSLSAEIRRRAEEAADAYEAARGTAPGA